MNPIQKKLIDLVEYVGHMVRLGEKPVFALADYHQLLFHEEDLKDRVGIGHDKSDNNGPLWLKIERLKRIDPPEIPEKIRDWISVGRDPFTQPTVHTVRTETIHQEQAAKFVKLGTLSESDIQPAMKPEDDTSQCDVIFRLEKQPDIKKSVDEYIRGPWSRWSEEERPIREAIRIYDAFFSLQQSIQSQGSEYPLELVWGIGVAIEPTLEQMHLSFEMQKKVEKEEEEFVAEVKALGSVSQEIQKDSFVEIGDRVLISYNDEPTLQHTIKISATEHDRDLKIIRADKPLAQALIDGEINEEVEIQAGGKTRTVTIIGIEKTPE